MKVAGVRKDPPRGSWLVYARYRAVFPSGQSPLCWLSPSRFLPLRRIQKDKKFHSRLAVFSVSY
jgi:hypothetical protein